MQYRLVNMFANAYYCCNLVASVDLYTVAKTYICLMFDLQANSILSHYLLMWILHTIVKIALESSVHNAKGIWI